MKNCILLLRKNFYLRCAVMFLTLSLASSCAKNEAEPKAMSTVKVKYKQYAIGSYDMIWLAQSKNLTDLEYVKVFKNSLGGNTMKNGELKPLNEAIFALEGLVNYEKADATPARLIQEDMYEISMNISSIHSDGEVWINQSQIADKYNEINLFLDVPPNLNISMVDLDVVGIDNNSVSIKIYKTISEKPTVTSSFNWFDENESYKALGQDVLSGNYSPNLCANDWNVFNPEIPCHIGYPNQPWPSWVYIKMS